MTRITRVLQVAQVQMSGLLDAERELRLRHEQSERKFRLIFENAETGIFVVGCDGRLQSWNPALGRILRLTEAPDQGCHPQLAALLGDRDGRVAGIIGQALERQSAVTADLEANERGHDLRWVSLVLNPIEEGLLQGVMSDITERKQSEFRVQALAERDALTGLWNRRGLERHVAALTPGRRVGTGLALLLLDLDGFKQVNDSYGHEAGDAVLREVASRTTAAVRHDDVVARLGGDEFVLVLKGIGSPEGAALVGDKLVAALSRTIPLSRGRSARIGASVGIAFSLDRMEPLESLLHRADMAMYAAKAAGKSRCCVAEAA